ncbi:MAG TPA: hypothetical protein VF310_07545 [Vicinamibacteria bacterium]
MAAFWFLVGSLAVFRVTHLLAAEDGPWQLLLRLRLWLGPSVLGALLDCFYCLSLWVAAPVAWALGQTWPERLLLWPALSGAAIVLERVSTRPERPTLHD